MASPLPNPIGDSQDNRAGPTPGGINPIPFQVWKVALAAGDLSKYPGPPFGRRDLIPHQGTLSGFEGILQDPRTPPPARGIRRGVLPLQGSEGVLVDNKSTSDLSSSGFPSAGSTQGYVVPGPDPASADPVTYAQNQELEASSSFSNLDDPAKGQPKYVVPGPQGGDRSAIFGATEYKQKVEGQVVQESSSHLAGGSRARGGGTPVWRVPSENSDGKNFQERIDRYKTRLPKSTEKVHWENEETFRSRGKLTIMDGKFKSKFIYFYWLPSEISENVEASWDPQEEIIGRSEPIYGYRNTSGLKFSFELYFVAIRDTFEDVWQKVRFVQGLTMPDYSSAVMKPPPRVRVQIAGWFDHTGIIMSAPVTWMAPFWIDGFPQVAKVDFELTEISDNLKDQSDFLYDSYNTSAGDPETVYSKPKRR